MYQYKLNSIYTMPREKVSPIPTQSYHQDDSLYTHPRVLNNTGFTIPLDPTTKRSESRGSYTPHKCSFPDTFCPGHRYRLICEPGTTHQRCYWTLPSVHSQPNVQAKYLADLEDPKTFRSGKVTSTSGSPVRTQHEPCWQRDRTTVRTINSDHK